MPPDPITIWFVSLRGISAEGLSAFLPVHTKQLETHHQSERQLWDNSDLPVLNFYILDVDNVCVSLSLNLHFILIPLEQIGEKWSQGG